MEKIGVVFSIPVWSEAPVSWSARTDEAAVTVGDISKPYGLGGKSGGWDRAHG